MPLLEFDIRNLQQIITRFDPKLVDKALKRTVNGIAAKSKTKISKEVRQIYTIKAAKINQTSSLVRANVNRPDAILKWVGRRIGLINFGARERTVRVATKHWGNKRKQVRVKVKKAEGLQIAMKQGANKGFIAVGRNGNQHIYSRTGLSRNNLVALQGPSVPQMVDRVGYENIANEMIQSDFAKNFNSNMSFYLGRQVGLL